MGDTARLPFKEIKARLRERSDRFMLIPHQVPTYCCHPVDWDEFDQTLTPLVEIYSVWGSGEYFGNPLQCRELDVDPRSFVDVALRRGYKMGFIASTDAHAGAPGDGRTFFNPIGAGMACVWAGALTRDSIFDALNERSCYATTGARIVLRSSMNGMPMGSDVKVAAGTHRVMSIQVEAPGKIREIAIVKNSEEIAVRFFRSQSGEWEWVDDSSGETGTDYYYPRVVLEDGETAWGSPVWLTAS